MKDVQSQAARIFARCFSEDELEFLQINPQFIEATHNLETIEDVLNAVEAGEKVIRETWKRASYEDSALTPKSIMPEPQGLDDLCSSLEVGDVLVANKERNISE